MNPAAILTQLENLALTHPQFVSWIAGVISAAFQSEDPFRAAMRHAIRTLAQEVGQETANGILGLDKTPAVRS